MRRSAFRRGDRHERGGPLAGRSVDHIERDGDRALAAVGGAVQRRQTSRRSCAWFGLRRPLQNRDTAGLGWHGRGVSRLGPAARRIAANLDQAHDFELRFKQELLLARHVTHRNVIRIHDLGECDGVKYITMQFVEGTDLSTILHKTRRETLCGSARL